jgi:hypothetical protein
MVVSTAMKLVDTKVEWMVACLVELKVYSVEWKMAGSMVENSVEKWVE